MTLATRGTRVVVNRFVGRIPELLACFEAQHGSAMGRGGAAGIVLEQSIEQSFGERTVVAAVDLDMSVEIAGEQPTGKPLARESLHHGEEHARDEVLASIE